MTCRRVHVSADRSIKVKASACRLQVTADRTHHSRLAGGVARPSIRDEGAISTFPARYARIASDRAINKHLAARRVGIVRDVAIQAQGTACSNGIASDLIIENDLPTRGQKIFSDSPPHRHILTCDEVILSQINRNQVAWLLS